MSLSQGSPLDTLALKSEGYSLSLSLSLSIYIYIYIYGSDSKEYACNAADLRLEDPLGLEDPLEKGMATHSRILAWRIPGTEEPGGLQSIVWQRVRHTHTHSSHIIYIYTHTQHLLLFQMFFFVACLLGCCLSLSSLGNFHDLNGLFYIIQIEFTESST